MEEVGGMAVVSSDEVKNVVEMVIRGYSKLLHAGSAMPWADTLEFIEFLEDIDDLDDSDLIDMLASWAGLSYNDFKRIWDDLTDSEKDEALDAIEYRMALIGLEDLMRGLATSFYVKEHRDVMKKMINIAKKYVSGKIDFDEFADEIEKVWWPTEKDKEAEKRDVWGFWEGITLASYLGEETVKEIVRKYLLEELEKLDALWIPLTKKSQVHKK